MFDRGRSQTASAGTARSTSTIDGQITPMRTGAAPVRKHSSTVFSSTSTSSTPASERRHRAGTAIGGGSPKQRTRSRGESFGDEDGDDDDEDDVIISLNRSSPQMSRMTSAPGASSTSTLDGGGSMVDYIMLLGDEEEAPAWAMDELTNEEKSEIRRRRAEALERRKVQQELEQRNRKKAQVLEDALKEEMRKRSSGMADRAIAQQRQTEDDLYQREKERLEKMQANLQRSQEITDNMVSIFNTFDRRLVELEENIIPIHKRTNQLKSIYTNIDSTLSCMQKILDVLDTASRVKPVIDEGFPMRMLAPDPKVAYIDKYMKAILDIDDAIDYLVANIHFKSSESALERLRLLRKLAIEHCDNAVETLISENSDTIDAASALPLEKLDAIESGKEKIVLFHEEAWLSIKKLVAELQKLGNHNHLKAYRRYRSAFALRCLERLAPEFVLAAGKAEKLETRGAARDYVKGTHKFIYMLRVLLILLKNERKMIEEIAPERQQFDKTAAAVIEPAFSFFMETGDMLTRVHRSGDRIFGIFPLIDFWDVFNKKLGELHSAVKVDSKPFQSQLTDFSARLSASLRRSFAEVEEDAAKDTARQLPADATVSELTSNTMNYLKRLVEYRDVVEPLLPPVPASLGSKIANVSAIGEYIVRVVQGLLTNLQTKAEKAKKKGSSHSNVFLLNNDHYILSALLHSDLLSLLDKRFIKNLQEIVAAERSTYRAAWDKALQYLNEDSGEEEFVKKAGERKLPNKIKKKIKARFAGFNSEVEGMFDEQKRYSIYDVELCEQLRGDIRDLLLPPYKTFLTKFEDSGFTTKPGKYIRYDVTTLETMISNFFEGQGASSKKGRKLLGK